MCGNFFVNYITVHLDRTSLTTLMFNILKGNKTWPISTAFDQWPTVNFDFSFPQDFPKAGGLAWCKKCWKGWSPCSKQLFLGFSGEIMRRSTAQTHPLMKCIGGWETWHSSHPHIVNNTLQLGCLRIFKVIQWQKVVVENVGRKKVTMHPLLGVFSKKSSKKHDEVQISPVAGDFCRSCLLKETGTGCNWFDEMRWNRQFQPVLFRCGGANNMEREPLYLLSLFEDGERLLQEANWWEVGRA